MVFSSPLKVHQCGWQPPNLPPYVSQEKGHRMECGGQTWIDGGASCLLNIKPPRKEPSPETPCLRWGPVVPWRGASIPVVPFWAGFLGSIWSSVAACRFRTLGPDPDIKVFLTPRWSTGLGSMCPHYWRLWNFDGEIRLLLILYRLAHSIDSTIELLEADSISAIAVLFQPSAADNSRSVLTGF